MANKKNANTEITNPTNGADKSKRPRVKKYVMNVTKPTIDAPVGSIDFTLLESGAKFDFSLNFSEENQFVCELANQYIQFLFKNASSDVEKIEKLIENLNNRVVPTLTRPAKEVNEAIEALVRANATKWSSLSNDEKYAKANQIWSSASRELKSKWRGGILKNFINKIRAERNINLEVNEIDFDFESYITNIS